LKIVPDSQNVLMAQGHPMGKDRPGIRLSNSHENVQPKKTLRGAQPAKDRVEAVGTTIVT
jgi:hypothetical protein